MTDSGFEMPPDHMVSQMRSTLDFNSPAIMGPLRHRGTLAAHLDPWDQAGLVDGQVEVLDPVRRARANALCYQSTAYFVNAPPAKRSEFGPSAANTLPSASTATPSPAAPWYGRVSASNGGM